MRRWCDIFIKERVFLQIYPLDITYIEKKGKEDSIVFCAIWELLLKQVPNSVIDRNESFVPRRECTLNENHGHRACEKNGKWDGPRRKE